MRDRFLLGLMAGIIANQSKNLVAAISKSRNWSNTDGPDVAAGMLLPAHLVFKPYGRVVGYLADNLIAGMLGVTATYFLSFTGTDKATLKGAAEGGAAWAALYGVLSTMGATRIRSYTPKTVASEFISHTLYGAIATTLIKRLGDPGLFNGKIPLSASSPRNQSLITRTLANINR